MAMTEDEIDEAVAALVDDHLSDYEYLNASEYVEENYEDADEDDVQTVYATVVRVLRDFADDLYE